METTLTSLLADVMREKKSTEPRKAYSYQRFSTTEQKTGDSFRRQTALARAYASSHGLVLDEELTAFRRCARSRITSSSLRPMS
jgi:hypothetical protein